MTYREAIVSGEKSLGEAGIADARNDAWLLLTMACKIDHTYYYMHIDEEMPEELQHEFEVLIKKRAERVPLQYITGEQEFMGMTFHVNSNVLIPRQDTETLVDRGIVFVKDLPDGTRVLDLCAGSGCIGLALASQAPQAHVVLGEFSDGALRICRQNTRRNALTGRVIPMTVNALERPDRALGEFHCIVSNPPYIPHGDIPGLDHSVKDYEPHLALDGGEDGLDFYRAISEKWKAALAPGGRLYFEVGIGQADAVLRIMRAQGFGDIQVVKDHNDIPRVVFGTLCGEVYSE